MFIVLLYTKAPDFLNHINLQGGTVNPIKIEMLNGKYFDSLNYKKPLVIVFWATWCMPCQLELSRLNKLVENNEIKADSILAISIQEESNLVKKESLLRGYKFQIAIDSNGQWAQLFQVGGTPTVIFLNQNQEIQWITTGISPTLAYRVKDFLK